jgi:hypothetical protein
LLLYEETCDREEEAPSEREEKKREEERWVKMVV